VAISDLLWACPECGKVGGVGAGGGCRCGASFRRGRGASIEATLPDGRVVVLQPDEWVDRLPDPATLLERAPTIRQARVTAREATGSAPLRSGGRYLNQVEQYGPKIQATLSLRPDRVEYHPEGEDPRVWPLEELTAVQTSSSTLQLRARHQPLLSVRFLDDSLFLWESLLHAALRDFYRRTGRGEIAEFQPRIVVR
jgi:hypothetical protein